MKKLLLIVLSFLLLLPAFVTWKYYSLVLKEEEKVKVIVAKNNGGQLCNQLWHFAHLIAYSKEMGYELYNPAFYRYAKHFEHFKYDLALSSTKQLKIYLPPPLIQYVQKKAHRVLLKVLKTHYLENRHHFDKEPAVVLPQSLLQGNHFFYDWLFESPVGLEKYRKEIMELLKPNKEYLQKIDQFWRAIDTSRLIVAVHIRHGDYRHWNGGKYFHSVEEIKKTMQEVATRYSSFRPQFIIFSDEKREISEFEGLDVVLAPGNLIEDLYSMARCDLIIGSLASTYCGWAAWYGNVPLLKLEEDPNWDHFLKGFES